MSVCCTASASPLPSLHFLPGIYSKQLLESRLTPLISSFIRMHPTRVLNTGSQIHQQFFGREQMRVGSGQIGNPPLDDPGPGKHSINQPTSILSLAPPNSPLNIFRICPFLGLARTLVICTWGPLSSAFQLPELTN